MSDTNNLTKNKETSKPFQKFIVLPDTHIDTFSVVDKSEWYNPNNFIKNNEIRIVNGGDIIEC